MQDDTGVIFANGFFPIETWVDEVSNILPASLQEKQEMI